MMFNREGIISLTCRDVDRSSHQGVVSAKWSKLAWPNPYADYHPLQEYASRCAWNKNAVGTRGEGSLGCWQYHLPSHATGGDDDAKTCLVVVSPGSMDDISLKWAACSQINILLQM